MQIFPQNILRKHKPKIGQHTPDNKVCYTIKMNDQKTPNIIGDWQVSAFTPFGVSSSTAKITSIEPFVSGTIIGERGSLDFDNGTVENNILAFSVIADTPIRATLVVSAEVIDDKFEGTLQVDEYMKIVIKGQKNVNL